MLNGFEQDRHNSTGEDKRLYGRQLIVCSLGRGGIVSDRIQSLVPPGTYPKTELVDPQTAIPETLLIDLFHGVSADVLLKQQIIKWLQDPTEGRPLRGTKDYLYGNGSLNQLRQDITRITFLKLRSLFPILFQAYKDNKLFIKCDVVARDTCQLLKAKGENLLIKDLFIYQSHPGPEKEKQYHQFLELYNAEYALLGTANVIISGTFPTGTIVDVFNSLELIFGMAHGLTIDSTRIPQQTDIQVFTPFHLAAFRISDEVENPNEVIFDYTLSDKPGGVNWDHFAVAEIVEFWRFPNGKPYLEMPSPDFDRYGIVDINSDLGMRWTPVVSGYHSQDFNRQREDFDNIRRGLPPTSCLEQILTHITSLSQ